MIQHWSNYLYLGVYKYAFEAKSWKQFWCRLRGHPNGPYYYSHGTEPDMRCIDCKEDLG